MVETIENIELKRFYQSIIQEIMSTQIAGEEGGILEMIFTQFAVDYLAEAGETENVRIAHDEKALGTKGQHKINAYSISENYETIDLFITIFKGGEEPSRIPKDEVDTGCKRLTNFFRKAVLKEYVNEIEESSEIFDFAHTLYDSEELHQNLVRVNAIVITDGFYPVDVPESQVISDYPIYYRVIDIKYLFDIAEKEHIPIEIDFKSEGIDVPCVISPLSNGEYQSYLAVIPGVALATIYEKYGSRLLEQNVRSFLQFTGKINKGIRDTIRIEPHMFLAFNNGLSATAESIEIETIKKDGGFIITRVKDFQIVNGGQTTASIYHTFKKYGADISNIFVPIKLNVIKNREKFSDIVTRISECANTQNKISVSDLSSNRPFHIQMEKLSRSLLAPLIDGHNIRTRWFYERSRGQYRNARLKEGNTVSKRKAFDLANPKRQLITKEELAKYINSYQEVLDGKKIPVGPHIVVRGNQKNYKSFIDYNLVEEVDSIFFEDAVAKAILFRSAEKIYGIKPNSIGELRFITVPYTISLLNFLTDDKLNLYKIWLNQSISEKLQNYIADLMRLVENFIKDSAPGDLYSEWAKKQECWIAIKNHFENVALTLNSDDLIKPDDENKRKRLTKEEIDTAYYKDIESLIKSISPVKWKEIYLYCKENADIPESFTNAVHTLGRKLRDNIRPTSREILFANDLLNKIIFKTSIFDSEEINSLTAKGVK